MNTRNPREVLRARGADSFTATTTCYRDSVTIFTLQFFCYNKSSERNVTMKKCGCGEGGGDSKVP
jgi:hypothetical protein